MVISDIKKEADDLIPLLGKTAPNTSETTMTTLTMETSVPTPKEKERTNTVVACPRRKQSANRNKLMEGNDSDPDDHVDDNVFIRLYKDPDTYAHVNRVIYLSRHGESEFNLYGRIGGNSPLSSQGKKYAQNLAEFFHALEINDLNVWTSELVRTLETAQHIKAKKTAWPQLNEISAGEHDGLTYEEIAENYAKEFSLRDQDKLRYRYPAGESYVDVCRRLNEVLPLLNKSDNLLVISHQAVVRCVVAYLMKYPIEQLPYIKIPLHTVMKVTFDGTRNVMESINLHVECVDTYRAKPTNCNVDRKISDAIQTVPLHL